MLKVMIAHLRLPFLYAAKTSSPYFYEWSINKAATVSETSIISFHHYFLCKPLFISHIAIYLFMYLVKKAPIFHSFSISMIPSLNVILLFLVLKLFYKTRPISAIPKANGIGVTSYSPFFSTSDSIILIRLLIKCTYTLTLSRFCSLLYLPPILWSYFYKIKKKQSPNVSFQDGRHVLFPL